MSIYEQIRNRCILGWINWVNRWQHLVVRNYSSDKRFFHFNEVPPTKFVRNLTPLTCGTVIADDVVETDGYFPNWVNKPPCQEVPLWRTICRLLRDVIAPTQSVASCRTKETVHILKAIIISIISFYRDYPYIYSSIYTIQRFLFDVAGTLSRAVEKVQITCFTTSHYGLFRRSVASALYLYLQIYSPRKFHTRWPVEQIVIIRI